MSKESLVLVIGQEPDVHIDEVLKVLKKKEVKSVVFKRHSTSHVLTQTFQNGIHSGIIGVDNKKYNLSDFSSVWWRMKPIVPSEFKGGVGSLVEKFIVQEWGQVLRTLHHFTSDAYWVNPYEKHERISYKPFQLKLAQDCKLTIPRTTISNNVDEIQSVFSKKDEIIYKTLSSLIVPPHGIIFSTKVTLQNIIENKESILKNPGIFQEYVDKAYEARITIVGDKVFGVKIDSQSSNKTSVDWRKDQLRPMYDCFELTSTTLKKLLKFHRNAGLVYAAYDFIISKEGEEIFLECNPGGQWLWLDNALKLGISEALADILAKRA